MHLRLMQMMDAASRCQTLVSRVAGERLDANLSLSVKWRDLLRWLEGGTVGLFEQNDF